MAGATSSVGRLVDKVVLITGGASGIGESIARLFRNHGAKVCIADIQDSVGHALCSSLGPHSCYVHCDVSKEEEMGRAVDFAAERFGALDVMVNNAGVGGRKVLDIRDVEMEEFKKVFEVNVDGVFLGMKHAARVMIPRGSGSIISLASVGSILGGMGPHAYTSSKHAILGLTKSVAAELGKHGVRVNCVSPYAVPTGLAMAHLPESERNEGAVRDFLNFVGSVGNLKGVELRVEDVAKAVLFLASDESRYVSGLNLTVDGGFTVVNNQLKPFET